MFCVTSSQCCYSTCSAADCVVPARGKAVVPTDLAIAIPPGTYARVAPRSGLAVKHFIDTAAGVVDEDYRGAVGVVLYNHGPDDFAGEHHNPITLSHVTLVLRHLHKLVKV